MLTVIPVEVMICTAISINPVPGLSPVLAIECGIFMHLINEELEIPFEDCSEQNDCYTECEDAEVC